MTAKLFCCDCVLLSIAGAVLHSIRIEVLTTTVEEAIAKTILKDPKFLKIIENRATNAVRRPPLAESRIAAVASELSCGSSYGRFFVLL